MDARTITNILLGIIILIVVYRWWAPLWKARQARMKREKDARLAIEVEPFYQEYLTKRKALREKHDPEHKWPEFQTNAPDMPSEYRNDIDALNEGYKGVLVLKFGDHIIMPK
jgi:hypothetical protein